MSEKILKKLHGGCTYHYIWGTWSGGGEYFFDPPKKIKPSVQKALLYAIYGDTQHLKLICTHQAHQNPPKTNIVEVKNAFLEGFGVPGGCKTILNVACLHKLHIAEIFGPKTQLLGAKKKKKKITRGGWVHL